MSRRTGRHRPFISLLIIYLFGGTGLLYGQTAARDYIVKGSIKDSAGSAIAYCSIAVVHTTIGTNTDEHGNFTMKIPAEKIPATIIVSSVGYTPDTIVVDHSQQEYNITLSHAGKQLTEVVVSTDSLRREETDPASVRFVSAAAIEQTTESNLVDALSKNVAGFNAVKTGPNVSKPFIHGLGYNRIETMYDGIPIEGQQFEDEEVLPVDAYNIDNAEIILGPSTLLNGPDALAGLVALHPSMPQDSDHILHGRSFSEYQSNNGLIGQGLRLSYGNSEWSFIVRGSYRIAKNYTNAVDGRVYNTGFREANASASILRKTENGTSSFNFTFYDDHQGIPDGSRDSLTRKFTKPIYEDPLDDIYTRPIVSDAELNSYDMSRIYQHIQHYRLYSSNHYRLTNNRTIDATIALQQNVRREYDYPIHYDQLGVSLRLNSLNYDFRYTIAGDSSAQTIIGMNGLYQSNKNVNATDIPIPDFHLFDIGPFLLVKLQSEKWNISGGLRYDRSYVTGKDFFTREDSATGWISHVYVPDTSGATLLFPAFNKKFKGFSLDAGASFRMNKHVCIKLNIARGAGAPHVSEFASNGLDGSAHAYFLGRSNIHPEESLQEDLSCIIHTRSFDAELNLFNNNMEDYIYLVMMLDSNGNPLEIVPGNKTYAYQQSRAQLYGAETMLHWHPSFIKGFSFTDYFSVVYGFNRALFYRGKGLNGEYLPLIPPLKSLFALAQDITTGSRIIPVITLRAEADVNAKQDRYLALNGTETETAAYTLFNAVVNVKIGNTGKISVSVQFQVNNILDTAYQSNLSRLKYFEDYSYSTSGHYGIYGMGRNFCGKLLVSF